MLRRLHISLLVVMAGVVMGPTAWPSGAWADAAAISGHAAPIESAKTLATQGVTLFREHQYEAARQAFARAYEIDAQAETLLELGLAELEANRPVEAAAHLRAYVGRSDAPAAKVDVVRNKWLLRAEAETARLDVHARPGAEIRVDGSLTESASSIRDADTTPGVVASVVVAAGEHDVTVRDGAVEQSRHVQARGGELVDVDFEGLAGTSSGPAQPLGGPLVSDRADAEHPAPSARTKWIAFLAAETAAIAAAGVAIGFSVAVENSASDANALIARVQTETGGNSGCVQQPSAAAECPQISRDRQAEHTNAALANGLYVAAGSLALIGAATWFLWPSPKTALERGVHALPMVGDRTAGVAVGGAW